MRAIGIVCDSDAYMKSLYFQDEKRVSIILENQLTESKALLEMKQTDISQLTLKVSSMSQHIEMMTSKLSDAGNDVKCYPNYRPTGVLLPHSYLHSESGAGAMAECVEKSMLRLNGFYSDTMTQMNEKLIHMEQRLVFATNRSCIYFDT